MRDFVQNVFEALERGRRFVTHDVWYVGRPGEEVPYGIIIKQVRVVILLMKNMVQDALLLRAAALTYTTLLSLVPFLAVMYFVIQQFDLGPNIADLAAQWTGNKGLAIEGQGDPNRQMREIIDLVVPGLTESMRTAAPPGTESTPEQLPASGPENAAQYRNPIDWLLDAASKNANPKALGTLGLLFILTAIFGLMQNIESSFNSIWGLRSTRSWYRMFSDYMMVTLLLPFVAMGMIGLTAALGSSAFVERLGGFSYGVRILQCGVISLAFTALYALVPNTKVKWRYALLGGFVAGTLWCLTSAAYFGLQYGLSRNSLVYSSFALFPLLLIWIYLSWTILLFGAELTFAYQNEKTFAMERLAAGASHGYREAVALRAMLEVSRRFETGQSGLAADQAAEEWNVPLRLLNETLSQLDEAGLVRRCAGEPVTFAPARSLDKITIGNVVSALRDAGREPSDLREDNVLEPLLREVEGHRSQIMQAAMSDVVRRLFPPERALPVDPNASGLLEPPDEPLPADAAASADSPGMAVDPPEQP
ncbi:MAG: YihY family inner membrane protein [Candidatus Hydrogenedentes bacterium]|nr:YihY family inner membrane protein [Candidatus Hydrogenedentota bacterium]